MKDPLHRLAFPFAHLFAIVQAIKLRLLSHPPPRFRSSSPFLHRSADQTPFSSTLFTFDQQLKKLDNS